MKNRQLQPNELTSEGKKSMKVRIIAGLVAVLPTAACLFLGDWVFLIFITLVLAIACYEILRLIGNKHFSLYIIYFIIMALVVYWPIFQKIVESWFTKDNLDWHVYSYFSSLHLPITILVVGIFALFFTVVLFEQFTVRDACLLATVGILVGLGLQSALYLRFLPHDPNFDFLTYQNTIGSSWLIVYILLGTMATDIGAYFVGVFFGKNKMNERISPKKTWEGFVGGIAISFLVSATFGFLMAFLGYPFCKALDSDHWYNILILSLLIPLFATLGDFVFSSIKRYYSIKDYGNLIPGHGGILDRLDSIIFTLITSGFYICIIQNFFEFRGTNPLI